MFLCFFSLIDMMEKRRVNMAENYSLKDDLFNKNTLSILIDILDQTLETFDKEEFEKQALAGFESRELKERVTLLREMLENILPEDYQEALQQLEISLTYLPEKYESFIFAAYQEYIQVNGCNDENYKLSLDYMGRFTKYFSAEFAIRDYINKYPVATFNFMKLCSKSEDEHRRRLASEGLRAKLPWAKKIDFDYQKPIEILSNLYYDESRYVTRSVANHMNDISKLDADLVVKVLDKWHAEGKQKSKEMDYVINHSLRTLIKKGHIEALALIGYPNDVKIEISNISVANKNISIGDAVQFEFDILCNQSCRLMIDYEIDYPMARGKRSKKVFKIKKAKIEANEALHISKNHLFKLMTTKKLYSGEYQLKLQVNGQQFQGFDFHLQVD